MRQAEQYSEKAGLRLKDLPDWPACLDRDEAMAYTGLSTSELQKATRAGKLIWKPVGARGRLVVARPQLDNYLASLFSDGVSSELLEDMDFGTD